MPLGVSADQIEVKFSVDTILFEDFIKISLPSNAKWSFSAVDLKTGEKILQSGNANDEPLVPGSIVKLFVAAAILDADARKRIDLDTLISHDGQINGNILDGNIYIKGSGNAFLSRDDLLKAIEYLRVQGIKEITGSIFADDTLFDAKGLKSAYSGPAYSQPSALGLDMHTVALAVFGRPPNVKFDPPNEEANVNFKSHGKPLIRQINDLEYEVAGITSETTNERKRFPLKDPAIYAAGTFLALLKEKGITLKGTIKKSKTPSSASEISRIKSKPLPEIVKDMNNNSLNVVAENLLLLLGAVKFGEPGTVEKGTKAIETFIGDIGIAFNRNDIKIADGSGLSHENRLTSEFMTNFLEAVSEKPWFSAFYESLPAAGGEGTLKNIGYVNKSTRAKTGQLNDAYSISGYADTVKGRKIAFSYIVNVPGADLLSGNVTGRFLSKLVNGEI